MKTIVDLKTTISEDGKTITLVGRIVERQPSFPVQQSTVINTSSTNRRWIRHVQLSHEALFVKLPQKTGVAFDVSSLVESAIQVESSLTYPPIFMKHPTHDDPSVEIDSELKPVLKWQVSVDGGETWTDAPAPDGKAPVVEQGQMVRAQAHSKAGINHSKVMFKPAPSPAGK